MCRCILEMLPDFMSMKFVFALSEFVSNHIIFCLKKDLLMLPKFYMNIICIKLSILH